MKKKVQENQAKKLKELATQFEPIDLPAAKTVPVQKMWIIRKMLKASCRNKLSKTLSRNSLQMTQNNKTIKSLSIITKGNSKRWTNSKKTSSRMTNSKRRTGGGFRRFVESREVLPNPISCQIKWSSKSQGISSMVILELVKSRIVVVKMRPLGP